MPFIKLPASEKKFGARETRIISVVVPVEEYGIIKTTVQKLVDDYSEDNIKRIKTVSDGIEEIVSMHLDIKDYIRKEWNITLHKYHSILFNHNEDLIIDLIAKYPVERKTPVKTLTEEKREKEKKLKKEKEYESSVPHADKLIPPKSDYKPIQHKYMVGTSGYQNEVIKRMKKAKKRKAKAGRR